MILMQQRRREAAEAEARAANRRVVRARVGTVVVAVVSAFFGRAL